MVKNLQSKTVKTMHEIEKYFKENKAGTVFVRYHGKKRRLFFSVSGKVCMVRPGHSFWGKPFSDWAGITKIYTPEIAKQQDASEKEDIA